MSRPDVRTRRIYDDPGPDDGARILVDRLWPRGVSKEAAALDAWAKELAPSDELRRWFDHDSGKWEAFRTRYADELAEKRDLVESTILAREGTVTLLYATTDVEHNNAVALKEHVEGLVEG